MTRLVILAPNWLGDAVMALPAIADVQRALPEAAIVVAARASIAPLFQLVPRVNELVTLERRGWRHMGADLEGRGFDAALLFPNSLHAALMVSRAGIPERWGYRTDWRGRLLTRAVSAPPGLHQIAYYQALVQALGYPNGPGEPRLVVPDTARESAAALLTKHGWDRSRPLVAIAPGAAYGGAKRWPPERFAELAVALGEDGVQIVMVGGLGDRGTANSVLRAAGARVRILDLMGTDLATLAGLIAWSRGIVTNDSGAMHLAVAVGTPITALFGPTDERATRPIGDAHAVITGTAWCRPCMLRECPLDHRCMRSIEVAPVAALANRMSR